MEIKVKLDGVAYGAIVSIILAVLKIGGHIDWPWVWILCPFWGMCCLTITILLIMWIWIKRRFL